MKNNIDTYQIFVDRGILTAEEIRKYKASELSAVELQKIEAKIMQSGFELDAIEGFQEFPESLNRLNKQKADFLNKHNLNKGLSPRNSFIITLSAAAIVLLGSVFIYKYNNPINEKIAKVKPRGVKPVQNNKETLPIQDSVSEEIAEMKIIDEQKIITPDAVKKDAIKVFQNEIANESKDFDIERLEIDNLDDFMKSPDVLSYMSFQKMPTLFINDLKVVDYSKTYTHSIDVLTFKFSGTPADKEHDPSEVMTDGEIVHIPYMTYLEETMILFGNNEFKKSLSKFKTILRYYENDENSFFYGGLCLYNLNRPKSAIQNFDKIIKKDNHVFNQEAMWFKAKCTYELGKIKETKDILNFIVVQNGFYKDQAKEMLKTLD